MKRLFQLKRKSNGQSTVEFALILPVLLLILLGIIEFGWLFSSRIIITSAAREGARVFAITNDSSQAKDAVLDSSAFVNILLTDITTSIDPLDPLNPPGGIQMATIKIDTTVNPLVRFIVRNPINMNATASMRLEFVP